MQSAGRFQRAVRCHKIYCAPGNAGIAEVAECVNIGAMEFDKLAAFAKENRIDLTVVGIGRSVSRRYCRCTLKQKAYECSDRERMQRFWRDLRHFQRI